VPQSACAYPISRQVLGETMLEAHLEYKTNEWSTTGTSRTENGPAARSSSDQPTLCSSRREGPCRSGAGSAQRSRRSLCRRRITEWAVRLITVPCTILDP